MRGAEWDIAKKKSRDVLWRSHCRLLPAWDWCDSHVFRVTGAHIHDFDEYAIEWWLGWSFVLFSFDSMFDTATLSVPPLYSIAIFFLSSLSGSCGWRRQLS